VVVAVDLATFGASLTASASCEGRMAALEEEREVKYTSDLSPAFFNICAYSSCTQGGTTLVVSSSSSMCSVRRVSVVDGGRDGRTDDIFVALFEGHGGGWGRGASKVLWKS
jgi:hypothetical protein